MKSIFLQILTLICFSASSFGADNNGSLLDEKKLGIAYDITCHQEVSDDFVKMGQANPKYQDTFWHFAFEGAGRNIRLEMRREMTSTKEVFMEKLETFKDGVCMTYDPAVGRIILTRNADKKWTGAGTAQAFDFFYNRNGIFDAYRWALPASGYFMAQFPTGRILEQTTVAAVPTQTLSVDGIDPSTHKSGKYMVEFDPQRKWPRKWTFETKDQKEKYEYEVTKWGNVDFGEDSISIPAESVVTAYYSPTGPATYVETIKWTSEITNFKIVKNPEEARFIIDPRIARVIQDSETGDRTPLGVPDHDE